MYHSLNTIQSKNNSIRVVLSRLECYLVVVVVVVVVVVFVVVVVVVAVAVAVAVVVEVVNRSIVA